MNRTGLWVRTGVIVAIMLIGIYLVFGPRHAPTASDFTWAGIKNNLANNINLGLDLKGGSHLVMRVKTDDYLKEVTKNNEIAAVNAAKEATSPRKIIIRSLCRSLIRAKNRKLSTRLKEKLIS